MQVLVIGDVHACYHTLKHLVKTYWEPKSMVLVQLGDLINKGKHTAKAIQYYMGLQKKYPNQVIWLRGNHEQALLKRVESIPWGDSIVKLNQQLQKGGIDLAHVKAQIAKQPLVWENEHVLVSHAGYQKKPEKFIDLDDPNSIINNRDPLKSLDKTQIIGHNVVEGHKPVFSPKENAWRIDTGAFAKKYLSGVLVSESGKIKPIQQPVHHKDKG